MSVQVKSKDPVVFDSLRLNEREFRELLGAMKQTTPSAARPAADSRRQSTRYDYDVQFVAEFHHPGGTKARYLVRSRNISESGLGFLHGAFIYENSVGLVYLPTVDDGWMVVNCLVVRCRLIQGRVHEVGVIFDEKIDLSKLLVLAGDAAKLRGPAADANSESKQQIDSALTGRETSGGSAATQQPTDRDAADAPTASTPPKSKPAAEFDELSFDLDGISLDDL